MIHIFPGEGYFTLYEDDGLSFEYEKGDYALTKMNVETTLQQIKLVVKEREGNYKIPPRDVSVIFHDGRQLQQKTMKDKGTAFEIVFDRM
jgi:alpha-glucosidase